MSVQEEFENLGVTRGGVLLLAATHAIQMIEECRQRGIRILGIDAFVLTLTAIQPVMEHSIDFTSVDAPQDCTDVWKCAAGFVQARLASGMHFEVVVDEPTSN